MPKADRPRLPVLPHRGSSKFTRTLCSLVMAAALGFGAATATEPDAVPSANEENVSAAEGIGPSSADKALGVIEAPDGASAISGMTARGVPGADTAWNSFVGHTASVPEAIRTAPVVVELFTSQGCSSCPPADRMLAELAARRDVLALAWHVDYWDYLGWADAFARPENTRRQEGYAQAAGERGVYTPQMIVDGEDTLITARPADLMSMIAEHRARPSAIMVTASSDGRRHQIQLTPRAAIPGGITVLLVRYAPQRTVAVKAGENRGRSIDYANVVLDSDVVATWDARAPLRLTVTPGETDDPQFPADTRHAILAQQALPGDPPLPGPILAAIALE